MTHWSLFSGIGGFDLAAEWAGWTNLFNCEIDPFCQKVLKYHFPNVEQYKNICETDFTVWRGRVNVLSGGFPCQPFSLAGKRKGTEDERHLWLEMLRAIREICPGWVVGENVPGILNLSNGLVFEQVCSDLENEGYNVGAYILPAASVNGKIRRERCWFIAKSMRNGLYQTPIFRRKSSEIKLEPKQEMPTLEAVIAHDFRPESHKHGIIDGIPVGLDECSIAAYGNAVVPQVVYQIFNAINQYEYYEG